MGKKTTKEEEEESGRTGKSSVGWFWVPLENIDFGVATIRPTHGSELIQDETGRLTKKTAHNLGK